MDNTGEDPDVTIVKMDKKSKKNKNGTSDGETHVEIDGGLLDEKVHKHKEKKKKKKRSESNEDVENGTLEDNGDSQKKHKKKKRKIDSSENSQIKENSHSQDSQDDETGLEKNHDQNPKKEKKKKKKKKKEEKTIENNPQKPKKKTKKVTFASDVEIFPSRKPQKTKKQQKTKIADDGLVRGKRFTPEEDEIVKQAVEHYIISNNLGSDGLQMILNCSRHKGLSKCWQEIGTCIPYRPYTAIYYRAHILFEQSEHRVWTPEEIKILKESHKKHGNKWKMIAEELGKHRFHVKDAWRRIKFDKLKSGKWSQEEYQNLYDMVNLDLQMKVNEQEKKSKHGMLRDNIPWTAISEKLESRNDATCCVKWYKHLSSSLVSEKKWMDADDYWMVGKLYEIDAACSEDVDWENLLEHRSGEICKKRWDQMVVCIENHRGKTFGEQVEILAKRYRPELAEVRQIWDDKPVVP